MIRQMTLVCLWFSFIPSEMRRDGGAVPLITVQVLLLCALRAACMSLVGVPYVCMTCNVSDSAMQPTTLAQESMDARDSNPCIIFYRLINR